ncbi:RmlC-like cupin domain-containing protein [Apodospora peruviana]|uniref:RmlC-like cupin domain-containing protein n=1 Tax=Apodospora peruviana TaxID=516989 RepID=A0AAE0IJ15_9PEZI|nr:RmlC-like cupin domain-containing protein [Apodospora peruviana]
MAIAPAFQVTGDSAEKEAPEIQAVIDALGMQPHIEGGYYAETDRDPWLVPSPFPNVPSSSPSSSNNEMPLRPGFDPAFRNASTTIFYLITPNSSHGNFHRNRARTVHTLHRGRGRYVLIHADEETKNGPKRVESFIVGPDVAVGEKLQWIVEGGKYKASFLPDDEREWEEDGKKTTAAAPGWLLISETVVPGFEFFDHDFLTKAGLKELIGEDKAKELDWLAQRG